MVEQFGVGRDKEAAHAVVGGERAVVGVAGNASLLLHIVEVSPLQQPFLRISCCILWLHKGKVRRNRGEGSRFDVGSIFILIKPEPGLIELELVDNNCPISCGDIDVGLDEVLELDVVDAVEKVTASQQDHLVSHELVDFLDGQLGQTASHRRIEDARRVQGGFCCGKQQAVRTPLDLLSQADIDFRSGIGGVGGVGEV